MIYDERRRYFDEHIGPRAVYLATSPRHGRFLVSKMVDDPFFLYYIINYSSYLQERRSQKQDMVKEMRRIAADIAAELKK
jgi:hypothetical protein